MTKNSAAKRAAREYQAAHNVPYTVALRRTKRLKVGDRVREIPGDSADIKKMPIGVIETIDGKPSGNGHTYDIRYDDYSLSIMMERGEIEAVDQ